MDNMPDDPDFKKFFEAAKPTWQNDNFGIRGNNAQTNREQAPVSWPRATVEAQPSLAASANIQPPVPPTTQADPGNTVFFSFLLEDASVAGNDTPKVRIRDGEVNGETPAGMGTDEYVLDCYDGAFINCIITYDTDTLDITSITFAAQADVPDSTLGTLYIEIGRTYVDYNDAGHISNFTAVNTQCGDINVEFVYGALNGQPALLPVAVYGTWVAIA